MARFVLLAIVLTIPLGAYSVPGASEIYRLNNQPNKKGEASISSETDLLTAPSGGELQVKGGGENLRLANGVELTLTDYDGGLPYTLRIGPDQGGSSDQRNRELAGWGWLSRPGSSEAILSDPRLSAVAVPEPKIYLMLGGFLLFVVAAKRQRDLQRAARRR